MWCHRLIAPFTFERRDVPDLTGDVLAEGQVLLRFMAAGICGSDLPGFRGTLGRLPGDTGIGAAEMNGFPVHEIVGITDLRLQSLYHFTIGGPVEDRRLLTLPPYGHLERGTRHGGPMDGNHVQD